MDESLIREYVSLALQEAAVDPTTAAGSGLGLASYESSGKRSLVLFDVKAAALAIVAAMKAGKSSEDDMMNALEPTIVGYLQLKPPQKGQQWGAQTVTASAAKKGHGPLMYDIAMSMFGTITPDRKHVSPSAQKVWSYYASNRSDIKALAFDDIEDPQTPSPQDDAVLHARDDQEPLNAAYTGAKVDTTQLEKNASKFNTWAASKKLDAQKLNNALKYAGAGFYRQQYLHSD